jgi:hypothetical protein
MQHGRILRVTPWKGGPYATYVVAEEDAAKAATILRTSVGPKAKIEPIGGASMKLLHALDLMAGEFKKTESP